MPDPSDPSLDLSQILGEEFALEPGSTPYGQLYGNTPVPAPPQSVSPPRDIIVDKSAFPSMDFTPVTDQGDAVVRGAGATAPGDDVWMGW